MKKNLIFILILLSTGIFAKDIKEYKKIDDCKMEEIIFQPLSKFKFNFKENSSVEKIFEDIFQKTGTKIKLIGFNEKKRLQECKLPEFKEASVFQILTAVTNKLNCQISAYSSDPQSIMLFSSFGKTVNFTNDKVIVSFTEKDDECSLRFITDWREYSFDNIKNITVIQNGTYKLKTSPYFTIEGKSFLYSRGIFETIELKEFDIAKPFSVSFEATLRKQDSVLFKLKYQENKLFTSDSFALKTRKIIHKDGNYYADFYLPFKIVFSKKEQKQLADEYLAKKVSSKVKELRKFIPSVYSVRKYKGNTSSFKSFFIFDDPFHSGITIFEKEDNPKNEMYGIFTRWPDKKAKKIEVKFSTK